MTLGERLKERRLELGMTLEAVGDMAGCSKQFVSQIEQGKREIPSKNSGWKYLLDELDIAI